MSKIELWKDIVGYEGRYQVSSQGRVRQMRFTNNKVDRPLEIPKLRKLRAQKSGHLSLLLRESGNSRRHSIHRLVLTAFAGPCPDGYQGAHLDGDPTNNRVENLKWATKLENEAHKKLHGTYTCGEKHSTAKLSEKDVLVIIGRVKNGETQAAVAKDFSISYGTVHDIIKGKKWKHLNRK